jgi:hypothetical protein
MDLLARLNERFNEDTDACVLVSTGELPTFEKYDKFIPGELLRRSYANDRLNVGEAVTRVRDIIHEFE